MGYKLPPLTRDFLTPLLIFFGTFLFLLPFYRFITLNADEGIVLQGAQRILEGQLPYRDFFSFYTPGSFYWTSLLLKLFGDSILVPRFVLLLYGGALSAATYILARKSCSFWVSLLAAYLTSLVALPFSFYVQHNWDSTILATAAVFCLAAAVENSSRYWWLLLGFLVSMTVLFEQSKGTGLLFGVVLGLMLLSWTRRLSISSKCVTALSIGFATPLLLTCLYFAAHHALFPMVADWLWPLWHYSFVNRVPYGYFPLAPGQLDLLHAAPLFWRLFIGFSLSPLVLIPALPAFALGLLIFHARRLGTASSNEKATHYVLVASVLCGLWLGILVSRRDAGHFIYVLPLLILPLAWMIDGRDLPSTTIGKLRPVFVGWILLSFSFLGISMLTLPLSSEASLQTRRGSVRITGIDTVIPYLQSHLKPTDKIFVYPYQPLYYYLPALSNSTPYEYFQPGMSSADQVDDILRQFDREKPVNVLCTTSFQEILALAWPGTPDRIIAQSDPIALYLVRHYRTCASLRSTTNGDWVWLYMVRMGTACPSELRNTDMRSNDSFTHDSSH